MIPHWPWPASIAANRSGRRVAEQVDLILNGHKPGDIPVEEPRTFRLVVNARAAQQLGLGISPSLRQQADEVLD